MRITTRWLEPAGTVVRWGGAAEGPTGGGEPLGAAVVAAAAAEPTLAAVLVAGRDPASQLWLNLLWLSDDAALRYFLTESDAAAIADRLPVCPAAAPAFLVACGGFFVDAFPAPLPVAGDPSSSDPTALLARVRAILSRYEG